MTPKLQEAIVREWQSRRENEWHYIAFENAVMSILSRSGLEAEARLAALEEAAQVVEGGSFLHENAPDALWAKACAQAIRERKEMSE